MSTNMILVSYTVLRLIIAFLAWSPLMSPLQLNNATTGYKNTLRECKTVGQRKTNILRNIISLFCCPTAFHARQ